MNVVKQLKDQSTADTHTKKYFLHSFNVYTFGHENFYNIAREVSYGVCSKNI